MVTTATELMHAILAMDSYNRSYESKLGDPNEGLGIIDNIGNASIIKDSRVLLDSDGTTRLDIPAGFYAISYNYGGETIISYRGTNSPVSADVWNGWITGGGAYDSPQALLGVEFFEAVIGTTNPFNADVTFVGHSLGGGLAGLMGSVYHQDATIFDNMPFELSAQNAWNVSQSYNAEYDPTIEAAYYFNGANSLLTPVSTNIDAFAVTGEVLAPLRTLQVTGVDYFDSEGGVRSPADLHSQALLVSLMFADRYSLPDDWQEIGVDFMDALFDDAIGEAVGAENADKMLNKIAYSALQEGERPFGDTALWSLFDDATDVGQAVKDGDVSDEVQNALSDLLVQYSAHLAQNDVEKTDHAAAVNGMLDYQNGQLTIDFSTATWGAAGNETKSNILGYTELGNALLGAGHGVNLNALHHIYVAINDEGSTLTARSTPETGTVNLFVGGTGTDIADYSSESYRIHSRITEGGGIEVANGDRLYGIEHVIGTAGNDTLAIGGAASNATLEGGEGQDTYVVQTRGFSGTTEIIDTDHSGRFQIGHDYSAQKGFESGVIQQVSEGVFRYVYDADSCPIRFDVHFYKQGDDLLISEDYWTRTVSQGHAEYFSGTQNVRIADFFDTGLANTHYDYGFALEGYDVLTADGFVKKFGTDGDDSMIGTGGDELLNALEGENFVDAGSGNDGITAGDGNDTLLGGDGNDGIQGGEGNNSITGDAGNDALYARYGNDTLLGGSGDDTLDASNGQDVLNGGVGNDFLKGGLGEDSYLFALGDGNDTISDSGVGDNIIQFGAGITSTDVHATSNGSHTTLTYGTLGDSVVINHNLPHSYSAISTLKFSDGSEMQLQNVDIMGSDNAESLNGTVADEVIDGAGGNDTLNGSGGNDRLDGGDGADDLDGSAGNDTLNGGAGNDRLTESQGVNVLHGGEGNDTINGAGADTVTGGKGDDLLSSGSAYFFYVQDGNDTITGSDSTAFNVIHFGEGVTLDDVVLSRDDRALNISYGEFGDTVNIATQFSPVGSSGGINNHIIDQLIFDDGSTLDISQGISLTGSEQAERVNGTPHDDTINAGAGDDTIDGEKGNNTFQFNLGDGKDRVLMSGSASENTIIMGEGIHADDITFYNSNNASLEVSYGYLGDKLTLNNQFSAARDNLGSFNTIRLDDGTEIDLTQGLTFTGSSEIDSLYGSNSDDVLEGLDGADKLYGYAGSDTFIGGTGDDSLYGEAGDDVYQFSLGDGYDRILSEEDADTNIIQFVAGITAEDVRLYSFNNRLEVHYGNAGDYIKIDTQFNYLTRDNLGRIDKITFSSGSDIDLTGGLELAGTEVNDTIYGTSADDILLGHDGNDSLESYAGDDRLLGGIGNDKLTGGGGADVAVFDGVVADYVLDDVNRQNTKITDQNTANGDEGRDTLSGIEVLEFSNGRLIWDGSVWVEDVAANTAPNAVDDNATTDENTAVVVDVLVNDTDAEETLDASHITIGSDPTNGSVVINSNGTITYTPNTSYSGNDSFTYTLSDSEGLTDTATVDVTVNAASNHTYQGTHSDDTLIAGAGDDTLYGNAGDDSMLGGAGDDYALGHAGNDTIIGGAGKDKIEGREDDDVLYGGADADRVYGGDGNDLVSGGTGDDRYLYGDDGADTIDGGAGDDRMYGGNGNDIFLFSSVTDSTAIMRDDIQDFVAGQDKIDVTGLGFNGLGATAGLLTVSNDGSNTYIDAVDNDFSIKLSGIHSLSANDFIGFGAPTNVAPTISGFDAAPTFTEGSAAIAVDSTISLSDADDTHLESATVTITNLVDGANEVLSVDVGTSGLIVDTSVVGTLTLTGTATKADYEAVLETLTYQNTATTLTTGSRTIALKVNDGEVDSSTASLTLSVQSTSPTPTHEGTVGNDQFNGSSGDDLIMLYAGDDTVWAKAGNDTIYGHEGNDYLLGDDGDDLIIGGAGYDNLVGGAGNDTLIGGADREQMQGNDGADVFVFADLSHSLSSYADKILSFSSGEDKIDLTGLGFTGIQLGNASGTTLGYTINGNGDAWVNDGGVGGTFAILLDNVTTLSDSDFIGFGAPTNLAPTISGFDAAPTFTEGSAAIAVDSTISLSDADDTHLEGATVSITNLADGANEVLSVDVGTSGLIVDTSVAGILTLTGTATVAEYESVLETLTYENISTNPVIGNRNLTLTGTATKADYEAVLETLTYQNTATTLTTGSRTIALKVNDGEVDSSTASLTLSVQSTSPTPTHEGTAGGDQFNGSSGDDLIMLYAGNDTVWAKAGNDTIYGHEGNDYLLGDDGDDLIIGGAGYDNLVGGAGNDTIIGGTDREQMQGNEGADVFVFADLSHSLSSYADKILDFTSGEDKLDLTGLGFTGIQLGNASGTTLGYTVDGSDNVWISDGNTFAISMTGAGVLNTADFIFG